jgi:aldehyde:ferredoxin oxidoreductase
MRNSYNFKILNIDLSEKKYFIEEYSEKIAKLLLGGKGLGTYLLYKNTKKGFSPLSPENPLIIVTGPLTGTSAPTSNRFGIITKSPKTNFYLDSYCGGFFGENVKYAGYDAIYIKGKAESPTILKILDEKIEFLPAEDLWGKDTFETNKYLKEKYPEFESIIIGPAGEKLNPISGIFSRTRCAGRGGSGTVMGSKNLKAVLVKGTKSVKVYNGEEFQKYVWIALRCLRMSSPAHRLKKEGTVNILELINASGGLPTRNFQEGQFENADKLFGEKWKNQIWEKDIACFCCPLFCSKVTKKIKGINLDGPDYETIFALGTNCGVSDKEAIVYANYLADFYGIDTISLGGIIGYLMELFQKGKITKKELDGIEPIWGDTKALIALTEKIGKSEGCGKELAKGVEYLSRKYKEESFAMQVKGMEMPAYHPNSAKGIALGYAVSERGACHLRGAPLNELMGSADPLSYKGKAELFKTKQEDMHIINSSILCFFVSFGITLKEIYQMINPATGFNYSSPKDLAKIGERITNLVRIFNLREGLKKEDDRLPDRCLKEPLPSGPARGEKVKLDILLQEYYNLMEWDKSGIPTKEKIKELGLGEIIK